MYLFFYSAKLTWYIIKTGNTKLKKQAYYARIILVAYPDAPNIAS